MTNSHTDKFTIAGSKYSSRLLVGTGKYKNSQETKSAIDKSGAEIITAAIRRTNLGQEKKPATVASSKLFLPIFYIKP